MVNRRLRRLLDRRSLDFVRTSLNAARGSLWPAGVSASTGQVGLDIGCGPYKASGFIGLDMCRVDGVDVVADLESRVLPFAANSFDVVYASHVLEHIQNLDKLMQEVSRVLKPGGLFLVRVPYAGSLRAFQDPTHVRFFTLKTLEYFVAEGARVGGWYQNKYFRRIRRRSLLFGLGPLSLFVAMFTNSHLSLLDLYESSWLSAIRARDLCIELQK